MKISVPVIANVDFLLLGGTVEGCRKAVELAKKGYTVFAATPYSHFGEDVCSTLELSGYENVSPAQLKHELDCSFIDAGIDFLFQSPVTALTTDSSGKIAGAIIANRTGFQAVNAKCILDATQWGLASQLYHGKNDFVSGEYEVSLIQIGACNSADDLTVEHLPYPAEADGNEYPVFRAAKKIFFSEFSSRVLNDALLSIRRSCFHPDMIRCADQCVFHFGTVYTPADPETGIIAKENFSAAESVVQKRQIPQGVKVRTLTSSANGFDAVRLDEPLRFKDSSLGCVEFDLNALPVTDSSDVLVVGAGTGGAPAAIAAARNGSKTIVTESMAFPGGVCTSGLINTYWYGNRCGFSREIDRGCTSMGPNPKFDVFKGNSYHPIWKQQWLMNEMEDSGVQQLYFTFCVGAAVRGNQVCGSVYAGPFGCGIILAKRCVDATGNADLVAAAGGKTIPLVEEEPAVQGAGLAPSPLRPFAEGVDENSDYSFVCDSDVMDASRFFVMSRGKFKHHFDVTNILDTRERRRIDGDLQLQPQDFYANRMYSDTITIARSNFDTHGFIIHPMFLLKATEHDPYYAKVPYRALLPKNLENILSTGLSVSAHRDCMPLIRMQPDVQNQGYAAGLAASMAAAAELPMRKINIKDLQKKLIEKEILPENILNEVDSFGGIEEGSSHYQLASVFLDVEHSLPGLKETFIQQPENTELAHILAFLGDDSGKELLQKTVDRMSWDKGWNYRGMGQFGPSASLLDSLIMALDRIDGATECVLKKLKTVSPETEFSHIRALTISLIRHPQKEAAADLKRLLSAPGMNGHAIKNYADALASNREERDDTSVRNAQLKEIYLAKALFKCDPDDSFGREILDSYRNSMQGYYKLFSIL